MTRRRVYTVYDLYPGGRLVNVLYIKAITGS